MSELLSFAWRNIGRYRGRTALTLAAISFGVVALVLTGGFIADVYWQLGESLIHSHSGHLQVARKGYFESGTRRPEDFVLGDAQAIANRIAQQPETQDVMARISFSGLLNNGRADLPIVGEGVEPAPESRLGSSLRFVAGRPLSGSDRFAAVIGKGLADSLGLGPGDNAVLMASASEGALNTLDVDIVGIFESFSTDYDARAVRVPIDAARDLLSTDPGAANTIVVVLHDTSATERAARTIGSDLREGLELRTWQQINDFYEKTVALYDRQFGVLRLIVWLMMLLAVANSVNMTVLERTAEFGTMRALGRRGNDVFRLVLVENLLLGALGGAIGVVVGVAVALAVSAIGIPMPPPPGANTGYVAQIRIVPSAIALAFLTAVAATAIACLLPARRAARIPVVDALRAAI